MSARFEDLEAREVMPDSGESPPFAPGLRRSWLEGPDAARRSITVSIPQNMAAGSERNSIEEFRKFLSLTKNSAADLKTQGYSPREITGLSGGDADERLEGLTSSLRQASQRLAAVSLTVNRDP
jgi:four helix bundle protein